MRQLGKAPSANCDSPGLIPRTFPGGQRKPTPTVGPWHPHACSHTQNNKCQIVLSWFHQKTSLRLSLILVRKIHLILYYGVGNPIPTPSLPHLLFSPPPLFSSSSLLSLLFFLLPMMLRQSKLWCHFTNAIVIHLHRGIQKHKNTVSHPFLKLWFLCKLTTESCWVLACLWCVHSPGVGEGSLVLVGLHFLNFWFWGLERWLFQRT